MPVACMISWARHKPNRISPRHASGSVLASGWSRRPRSSSPRLAAIALRCGSAAARRAAEPRFQLQSKQNGRRSAFVKHQVPDTSVSAALTGRAMSRIVVIDKEDQSMTRMLRLLVFVVAILAAVAISTPAWAATTTNPANAPQGTHYKPGTASCSVSSSTGSVTCSSYTLAGVGNTDVTANLSATYSATVVCINGGGNPSDSQHQGSFTQSATSGTLQPKNGNVTVPSLSASAPTAQQFLAQQTCPNPNWTPELKGPITLSSFTYTVQFLGFSGPYITITG